jgi:hypothetical protein
MSSMNAVPEAKIAMQILMGWYEHLNLKADFGPPFALLLKLFWL